MKQLRLFLCFLFFAQAQTVKADGFRILDKEHEALQCRIDLTVRAKVEILVSTYIIREDEVGLGLLQLMIEKAATGVKVKLILDAFGNEISIELLNYLIEHKVDVHLFHKASLFKLHTLTDRMHEKVLITDTENLIVGGRNLSNNYFKIDSTGNFLDTELYAKSKNVAQELRNHFFTMWRHRKLTRKPTVLLLTDEQKAYWKSRLEQSLVVLLLKGKVIPYSTINWAANGTNAQVNATYDNFVPDPLNKKKLTGKKDIKGTHQLLALIDTAKTTIDFKNPYFHPTRLWYKALKRAIHRGVKIRLLTNSECTSDVLLMQAVYRRSRPKYLKMGIQIWEYEGKEALHTKSFVIDSSITVIGSYNIHTVSQKNNTEVCLWVKDKVFGQQNIGYMNKNLASAKNIENIKANHSNCRMKKNALCVKKKLRYYIYVHFFAPCMSWFM